jgi:hypothetical protein
MAANGIQGREAERWAAAARERDEARESLDATTAAYSRICDAQLNQLIELRRELKRLKEAEHGCQANDGMRSGNGHDGENQDPA